MAVNYATAVRSGCHLESGRFWSGYGVHHLDLGYPETLDRLASSPKQVKLAYDWQNYDRGYQLVTLMADGVSLAKPAAEKVAQFRETYPT